MHTYTCTVGRQALLPARFLLPCTHTCVQPYDHTDIYTYKHACMHTYTHNHISVQVCGANLMNEAYGSTSCSCVRGFYLQLQYGYCVPCAPDHYKETLGDEQALCLPCPTNAHRYANLDRPLLPYKQVSFDTLWTLFGHSLDTCAYHSDAASVNKSACVCDVGVYSDTARNGGNCLACPPGSIKPAVGPQVDYSE